MNNPTWKRLVFQYVEPVQHSKNATTSLYLIEKLRLGANIQNVGKRGNKIP